jgi:hypothetical protein
MNRLRDETGDDPVAVRGIELLRSTPPAARAPATKRRVWMSLQRARTTESRGFGFRLPKVRMAVVVIGMVCVAGSAGAVIAARRWIAPVLLRGAAPAPSVPTPSQGHEASVGGAVALRQAPSETARPMPGDPDADADPASSPVAASGATPDPVGRVRPTRAPVRKVAPLRRASTTPAPRAVMAAETAGGLPALTPATARERSEVLDAMVSLRRDHDPVRAGKTLDSYLSAHPTGALREEALVLSIEAAGACGDVTLARRLARQYQSAYPTGRFREFARTAAAHP